MKKHLSILLALTIFLSPFLIADTGYKKGTVKNIRVHHEQLPGWEPPIFWFTITGVNEAASCPKWHGNVLFVGDSDQALSIVLASYMSGKELAVHFDDTKTKNGWCSAKYITVGDPAPLH